MKIRKEKKNFVIISLALLVILASAFFSVDKSKAAATDTGSGWFWSGTGDGAGLDTGFGWGSMNNADPGAGGNSYGVNIPTSDGTLVNSYAWSENVGWISFNAADLTGCPYGTCSAQRVGNNLIGWARIVGIETELAAGNSGGWKGWISLGNKAGDPVSYGIQLNVDGTITQGQTTSYGYSDELGWIDFSKAKMVIPSTLKVCRVVSGNGCNGGVLVSGTENMNINEQRTYQACYNTSAACSMAGNVTGSASWTDNNTPNNVVTVSSGTITAGNSPGSEGANVRYNPGSGDINTPFTVQVNAPSCDCNHDAVSKANTCTTDTYNDTCGNQVCPGAKTDGKCANNGGYIETAP